MSVNTKQKTFLFHKIAKYSMDLRQIEVRPLFLTLYYFLAKKEFYQKSNLTTAVEGSDRHTYIIVLLK